MQFREWIGVCILHFTSEDLSDFDKSRKRRTLRSCAIPKILLNLSSPLQHNKVVKKFSTDSIIVESEKHTDENGNED
jgi:hypothetical protein